MNKIIYKQYDNRWANKPYPNYGSTFSGNGCGCVACAHLMIEQDKYKNTTPEYFRKWMVKQGFAISGQGTTWSGIYKTLEHFGYQVVHIGSSDPMSKAWKELDKGNRIGIILFSAGYGPDGTCWTLGGHYIAFTDYKKTSSGKHKMYMKDSGPRDHDGWYYYENSMKGRVFQMWIVEKINSKSDSTSKDTETKETSSGTLKVDGVFGSKSVKALQKVFGTTQDGVISGQVVSKKYHTGFADGAIQYGSGGSALVTKMQRFLKLSDPDGQLGPNTIKAWQKFLNMNGPDGYWGPNTSRATQKWLNTDPKITISSTDISIKGIDISNHQGKLSLAKFKKIKKSGIKFVILRLGYTGRDDKKCKLDAAFENNYKNAIEAGLPVGIYYYSLATSIDKAKTEAQFVVKNLKGKTITYPVYIDIEDSKQINCTKATLASVSNEFCKVVNKAGYKAGVYASLSWFNNKIGKITESHSKWVAQYNYKCEYTGKYDIWQYSSSGSVPGISGNVDMDYCYTKFK